MSAEKQVKVTIVGTTQGVRGKNGDYLLVWANGCNNTYVNPDDEGVTVEFIVTEPTVPGSLVEDDGKMWGLMFSGWWLSLTAAHANRRWFEMSADVEVIHDAGEDES